MLGNFVRLRVPDVLLIEVVFELLVNYDLVGCLVVFSFVLRAAFVTKNGLQAILRSVSIQWELNNGVVIGRNHGNRDLLALEQAVSRERFTSDNFISIVFSAGAFLSAKRETGL